jgi:hypothetical protein
VAQLLIGALRCRRFEQARKAHLLAVAKDMLGYHEYVEGDQAGAGRTARGTCARYTGDTHMRICALRYNGPRHRQMVGDWPMGVLLVLCYSNVGSAENLNKCFSTLS